MNPGIQLGEEFVSIDELNLRAAEVFVVHDDILIGTSNGQSPYHRPINADGERFLMLKTGSGAPDELHEGATEIVLVQNWFEELKRLSPLPEANQ